MSSFQFNDHYKLRDTHAFLSPSGYHWLRYDDELLKKRYFHSKDAERGTELHAFAAQCIRLKQRLYDSNATLNRYVNDAIGFGMEPEVVLYYSDFCFGSADAICFENNTLRISDLKTGCAKASFDQLMIYAGLFCLEYKISPLSISFVLRIYQKDDYQEFIPEGKDVKEICNRIVHSDNVLREYALTL